MHLERVTELLRVEWNTADGLAIRTKFGAKEWTIASPGPSLLSSVGQRRVPPIEQLTEASVTHCDQMSYPCTEVKPARA